MNNDNKMKKSDDARNLKAKLYTAHSHPAPHAQPSDWRRRSDSHVQHRHFEARLLQCPAVQRTWDDIRQTAACPEQPDQCHLLVPGSHRPLLWLLHWLPVRQQVIYKVALLTYKVQLQPLPAYLSDLVHTHILTRALHSSDAPLLVVPGTQTELTWRAFSVAAPSTWNSLPADIRAFPHFSATWKPICSDSLSPPVLQVPLYLRTSWHYTNVLLYYYFFKPS